ncbi:NAD(P)-dependent oxidoreductase [uncultured Roseivirga sp.]|uniref:NAD-dependent epimerase/dehydratase family protein n=1 Tax=uncultured Roseivirga sp. TaxID=543088 RepID=UPI0030D78976
MKKVLVTGANGLVGRAVALKLSDNTDLHYVVRDQSKALNCNGKIIVGDLHNINVFSEIERLAPDVIVHCAAQIPRSISGNDQSIYDYNNRIDQSIFSVVNELGCWLIYFSSTAVYGMNESLTEVAESSKTNRSSFYAAQKIDSEGWVTRNIKKGLILRINAPYDEVINESTVLGKFLNHAIEGSTLKYYGNGTRVQDFTNVLDIATLISHLIQEEKLKPGIFNISFGDPINMKNLAELIVKLSKGESKIESSGNVDPQENYRAIYSIEKAKEELGWLPRISLSEGIQKILENSSK